MMMENMETILLATLSTQVKSRSSKKQSIIFFFRVESKNKKYKNKLISSVFPLPVKNSCGPTASLLPVNILTPAPDKSKKHQIQFNVPGSEAEPRETILRIVNGAQINAPIKNRIKRAVFTLNNQRLLKLRKSNNIIEIPVTLKSGSNILEVSHLKGHSEQRVSVEIKACADQIILSPINDTLIADKDTLQSSAKITAQGVPVNNANVLFNISDDLATESQHSVLTAENGIANILTELSGSGNGELSASVADSSPLLEASTPIKVIDKASIKLNQGFQRVTLTLGETKKLPYFLFYLSSTAGQQLVFETSINAQNTEIELVPDNNNTKVTQSKPESFVFEPTVKALSLGNYQLTARATVVETGETFSKLTEIHVTDQGTPEALLINAPGLTPSAISPSTSTVVNVHAFIEGTNNPPLKLFLDEVDAQGHIINSAIAELTDQGVNGDSTAGDFIYSADVPFNKPLAQTVFLRIRSEYAEKTTVSSITPLLVTPFETFSSPPDLNELIDDTASNDKIFANELLVRIITGTSPDRTEEIANSINGIVLNVIPEINLYRIQFTGDGTLNGIEQATLILKSFSEVLSVATNSIVEIAGSSCSATDCPTPDPRGQWHLNKITAREAWNAAKLIDPNNYAGAPNQAVAVIDFGLDCSPTDLSDACTSIDSGSAAHGTEVARVIGTGQGQTDSTTGVAWNSKIYSYVIDSTIESLLNAISRAGNKADVKIINLSVTKLLLAAIPSHNANISNLRDIACSAAKKDKLLVAAVGQPTNVDTDLYPARLNADLSYVCPDSDTILSSHILAVAASDRMTSELNGLAHQIQHLEVIMYPGLIYMHLELKSKALVT